MICVGDDLDEKVSALRPDRPKPVPRRAALGAGARIGGRVDLVARYAPDRENAAALVAAKL